ncbi:adenylate kinase family enzyme [Enterococcus sp. PF1-24]|uniref:adenylate kinase n=1 Tax=unclassified Enterococcus TaxID=2608891 RepID=UPI0024744553|nr:MULTISPECIES: adenylate kinase [unclassified Enterococcus]MDH6363805.1 adenylate kinase family enzyme [Enterococcus sp. PFB1-1]MDH6401009.1 adenylate kinase family enzyme [Enterococcus sp. PF1-24]
MMKVIVIGCPGAGKSTFSRKLREQTDMPLHYLDRLWHNDDRTTVSEAEFDQDLTAILQQENWILDGNYLRTLELRLQACDTVFFLDYPVEVCLAGVETRIGKDREDLPWVETEFEAEFKQWILDFAKDQRPQICQLLDKYQATKNIFIFKTREAATAYLNADKK